MFTRDVNNKKKWTEMTMSDVQVASTVKPLLSLKVVGDILFKCLFCFCGDRRLM